MPMHRRGGLTPPLPPPAGALQLQLCAVAGNERPDHTDRARQDFGPAIFCKPLQAAQRRSSAEGAARRQPSLELAR